MRAHSLFKYLGVAAVLLSVIAAVESAIASEVPTKSGHVRYTTGTAAVRGDHASQRPGIVVDPARSSDLAGWQVASVDASVLAGQGSMIAIKPATFEVPSAASFETDATTVNRGTAVRSSEVQTKNNEPGFWAPALSTLALALFFFLRRLA